MKWFALLFAAALMPAGASGAGLGDVKTVYLLPMSGSLDQYLAIRLTTGSVLQVVTDPQKADAIFTDRIGSGLEETLADLFNDKPKEKSKDEFGSNKPNAPPITRGRGAIFLVDRKTRDVLWAANERPKNSSPEEIERAADRIAGKLARSLKGK
jgi:hypothetical protein